jgi:hypothetical protein
MGQQRGRNEEQIPHGKRDHDAFPRHVPARAHRERDKKPRSDHGISRRNAEIGRARADRDEFGDEREQVADREIGPREASPRQAEAIDDQFGVSAARRDADAHDHLLDDIRQRERENDERDEEAHAERRARRGVGEHARAVVLAQHHEDAGSGQERKEPHRPVAGTRALHAGPIAGPYQLFA